MITVRILRSKEVASIVMEGVPTPLNDQYKIPVKESSDLERTFDYRPSAELPRRTLEEMAPQIADNRCLRRPA